MKIPGSFLSKARAAFIVIVIVYAISFSIPGKGTVRKLSTIPDEALTLTTNDNSDEPFISLERQNQWIENEFKAADPHEQEWCVEALKRGTYWKRKIVTSTETTTGKGAQF